MCPSKRRFRGLLAQVGFSFIALETFSIRQITKQGDLHRRVHVLELWVVVDLLQRRVQQGLALGLDDRQNYGRRNHRLEQKQH